MPKIKTRKTLAKRVKITKTGKILKKQTRNGHLKRKMDTSRKNRKSKTLQQENEGHIKVLRKLLGQQGKGIKINA